MNADTKREILGAFLAGMLLGVVMASGSFALFHSYKLDTLRSSAVDAGVAEWRVDSYGYTTFHWKHKGRE